MASSLQKPTSDPSRDDISDSASDVSTESSQGWDDAQDVEEDTGDESPAICLFCKETRPSAHQIFLHAKEAHDFDWQKTVAKLGLFQLSAACDCRIEFIVPRLSLEEERKLNPFLAQIVLTMILDCRS